MKHLLFVLTILLSSSFVFAQTTDLITLDWSQVDCAKGTFGGVPLSQVKAQVPNELTGLLNGESITLDVTEKGTFSGDVDNGLLHNVKCGEHADATLAISLPPHALTDLANSPYPAKTFKELKEHGDIIISPRSPLAMAKVFFISIALLFT